LKLYRYVAVAAVLLLAGCGIDTPKGIDGEEAVGPATSVVTTGLEGHVIRGPVQPVCITDQPCEVPFAATFHMKQNGASIQKFATGADGCFVVYLEPGVYEIVPDKAR
jgi:hypothetical protein